MKSRTSSEPLSSITSVKNRIKPTLEELADKYDQALTNFDDIINNWKEKCLLRYDGEYVGAIKRAFEAIRKGTECKYVEVDGHGAHLTHRSDPCKMLHAVLCGKQGKHFIDMVNHFCVNQLELKNTLTNFVHELKTILQPFVSELHKTINACKISHTEKGLDIEFSSAWMAQNVKRYYATEAGESDQIKVLFGKIDPIELQENHILIRHSKGLGDVGVFRGGNYDATQGKQPAEVAISFPNEQARNALLRLLDSSKVRTYTNLKALYFCNEDSQTTLPYDDHHKSIEFIGSIEFCDY